MSAAGRIERRFEALAREGRPGLVAFITAGDPDAKTSLEVLCGLPGAGADIVELGMPFSDPVADGPAIQASSLRALQAGQTVARTLAMASRFRGHDPETPLVLMGYFNPIYSFGVERFVERAKDAGVDGLIVVDLPPEEIDELRSPARRAGIHIILLVAPTTGEDRLPFVLRQASGFVYYVSITGITGTASASLAEVSQALERIRRHTALPIAVGFGVKSREQVEQFGAMADAVVVGSAVVSKVAEVAAGAAGAAVAVDSLVLPFVRELAAGVRGGRTPVERR